MSYQNLPFEFIIEQMLFFHRRTVKSVECFLHWWKVKFRLGTKFSRRSSLDRLLKMKNGQMQPCDFRSRGRLWRAANRSDIVDPQRCTWRNPAPFKPTNWLQCAISIESFLFLFFHQIKPWCNPAYQLRNIAPYVIECSIRIFNLLSFYSIQSFSKLQSKL